MDTVLILFGILLIFLIIAAVILKTKEMEQENHLLHSYMVSIEELYEGIQDRMEAARRYRHDLAKHIQTLEVLLQEKSENQNMKEYMEDLKERYCALNHQDFCSDEIVNSILTIKSEQCREKGIPLYIQVEDLLYSGIKEVDFVGLLHNLLDNAMEANERIPANEERGIWFSMRKHCGEIIIEIKNCIPKGEKISFRTSKAQKEEHGIGMKIIQSLVEKYEGSRVYFVDPDSQKLDDRIRLKCSR